MDQQSKFSEDLKNNFSTDLKAHARITSLSYNFGAIFMGLVAIIFAIFNFDDWTIAIRLVLFVFGLLFTLGGVWSLRRKYKNGYLK